MKRSQLAAIAAATVVSLAAASFAVPIMDGTRDAQYGPALAVQQTGTSFGNSTTGSVEAANGSELDAAYGFVEGGNLHIFIAGNLETNFNKFELFIDSRAGGQNRLRGDNPDVDFNGLNRMGDNNGSNGLTFDAGFESDFYLTSSGGGTPTEFFANYAETNTAGGGNGRFIGQSGTLISPRVITGTPGGVGEGIVLAYNNSNIGGVASLGNPNTTDPATVTTGIEILIPLSQLGNPTGDIRLASFINGSSHDFSSNQWLGSLPLGTDHLGEPRNINLGNIPGNQFFTVAIPEPTTLAGALVALGLIARRRRA